MTKYEFVYGVQEYLNGSCFEMEVYKKDNTYLVYEGSGETGAEIEFQGGKEELLEKYPELKVIFEEEEG